MTTPNRKTDPNANIVKPLGHGTDELFHSTAFVSGFSDKRRGMPPSRPINSIGPNKGERSADIAYERGRLFAVVWGNRSIIDATAMKAALDQAHKEGLIL